MYYKELKHFCFLSLRARQAQWKRDEEERLAQMPDPSVPPGHVLMPTDERLQTLNILEQREFGICMSCIVASGYHFLTTSLLHKHF